MQRNSIELVDAFANNLYQFLTTIGKDTLFKHQEKTDIINEELLSIKEVDVEQYFNIPDINVTKKDNETYRTYLKRLNQEYQLLQKEYLDKINILERLLKAYREKLTNYKRMLSDKHYSSLINKIEIQLKTLFESKNKIKDFLNKLENKRKKLSSSLSDQTTNEDTITIRLFYKKEEEKNQSLFFSPSGGHVSLELQSADGMRSHYISLYPDNSKEPIEKSGVLVEWAGKTYSTVTDQNIPKTEVKVGKLVSYSKDKNDFKIEYAVTLPCRKPLDFDKADAWATSVRNQSVIPFQLYENGGDNCSSLVLLGLDAANAGEICGYTTPWNGVPNPLNVYNYVKLIEATQHKRELEKQISEGTQYTDQDRTRIMFEITARKIESFILTYLLGLQPDNNHPADAPYITYLFQICEELIELSDKIRLGEQVHAYIEILSEAKDLLNGIAKPIGVSNNTKQFEDVLTYLTELQQYLCEFDNIDNINEGISTKSAPIFTDPDKIFQVAQVSTIITEMENNKHNIGIRWLSAFNKGIIIEDAINKIGKMRSSEAKSKTASNELITFYNETIINLNQRRGRLNQAIYFDQYSKIWDDQKNLLNQFKNLFPNKSCPNDSNRLSECTSSLIESLKSIPCDSEEIPSLWNTNPFSWFFPSTWTNRWEKLQHNAQNIIYQTINRQDIGLTKKMEYISQCIDNYKPSIFEFLRKDERRKYEELEIKAKLLCITEAFSNGNLDMMDFSIKLKELAKSTNSDYSDKIKDFANAVIKSYKDHAEIFENNQSITKESLSKNFQEELSYRKNRFNEWKKTVVGNYTPVSKSSKKLYGLLFNRNRKNTDSKKAKPVADLIDTVRKARKHFGRM